MQTDVRILLAEDDEFDAQLTRAALNLAADDETVLVVPDGRQALDYLYRREQYAGRPPPQPAVVLLDLKLPRIDGLEVLRRIRADQRTALLPVVMLTTSREPLDLAQAYRLGANSYIRKPVDFDRFERAIGLVGHYWLELNETTETVARGAY